MPIEVNRAPEKAYKCEWLSTAGYDSRARGSSTSPAPEIPPEHQLKARKESGHQGQALW